VPRITRLPVRTHRHRYAVMAVGLLALAVTACTGSPPGTAPPSTFGADSPWLGTLTPVALPAPVNALAAVDCVSASRCWAVGTTLGTGGAPNGAAVVGTTDGGSTWISQTVPASVGFLSGVACSSASRCTAVGQAAPTTNGQGAIVTTADGGAAWTVVPTPPGLLDLTAVTCQRNGRCVAVGNTATGSLALVSADGGTAWSQAGALPAPVTGATGVSCADALRCWVTGHNVANLDTVLGTLAVTVDGGTTWTLVSIPPGIGNLSGVACLAGPTTGSGAFPTTTTVAPATTTTTAPPEAANGAGSTAATTMAPTTTTPPPTTTAPVIGAPGVRCTVVGTTATSLDAARTGHGVIITTANGGATWTNQPVTARSASLADVSCVAVGTCVAVGSTVAATAAGGLVAVSGKVGSPWAGASLVGSALPLTSVSCISVTRCVIVGESISEHLVGG
jgi:hypothetical protein